MCVRRKIEREGEEVDGKRRRKGKFGEGRQEVRGREGEERRRNGEEERGLYLLSCYQVIFRYKYIYFFFLYSIL